MIRILLVLFVVLLIGWVAWPAFSAYQIYGGMKSADVGVLQKKINWTSLRTSLRPVVSKEVDKAISKFGGGGVLAALGPQIKQQFAPKIIDMALKNIVTPEGLSEVMAHGGDVSSMVSKMVRKQVGKLGGLGNGLGGALGGLTGGGDSSSGGGLGGALGGLFGGGKKKGGLGSILGGLAGNKHVRDAAGGALGKVMGGRKRANNNDDDEDDSDKAKPKAPSYGFSNLKRFAYTGLGSMEVGVAKDPAADSSDIIAVMEFQDFDWKLTGLIPKIR